MFPMPTVVSLPRFPSLMLGYGTACLGRGLDWLNEVGILLEDGTFFDVALSWLDGIDKVCVVL
jgi:hypothetical protein